MKPVALQNGLTLNFIDHTRHYFGGYYRVSVEVTCAIPVIPEYFSDNLSYSSAVAVVGDEVTFSKVIEKMGIHGSDVDRCISDMINHFNSNSLLYVSSPDFPRKAVLAEVSRRLRVQGVKKFVWA